MKDCDCSRRSAHCVTFGYFKPDC